MLTTEQVKKLIEDDNQVLSSNFDILPTDDLKTKITKTLYHIFIYEGNDEEEYHPEVYNELYEELTQNYSDYFTFRTYPAEPDVGIMTDYTECDDIDEEAIKSLLKDTIIKMFPEAKDNDEMLTSIVDETWKDNKIFDQFIDFIIPKAEEVYEDYWANYNPYD